MEKSIEAVFDGKVICPDEPLELEPNTRVRILIERVIPDSKKSISFLQTARSLRLEGSEDWAENIENYLYSESPDHGE